MENLPETTSNPISQGCGPDTRINVQVSPTTGGDFYISIESNSTVENLKKLISKRLKVPRDRICLLFRDKWVFISKYSYFFIFGDIVRSFPGNFKREASFNMVLLMDLKSLFYQMWRLALL